MLAILAFSLASSVIGAAYPMETTFPPQTASGRLHGLSEMISFAAFATVPY